MPNTTTTSKNSTPSSLTILDAINEINTSISFFFSQNPSSHINSKILRATKPFTDYLGQRLNLTPVQCILLSTILESGIDEPLSTKHIANRLNCTNVAILSLTSDFELLMRRKLIYFTTENDDCQGFYYMVPSEVVQAFRNNESYQPAAVRFNNRDELLSYLDSLFIKMSQQPTSTKFFFEQIDQVINDNNTMPWVKNLLKIAEPLSPLDRQYFFMFVVFAFHAPNRLCLDRNYWRFCFDNEAQLNAFSGAIVSGASPLVKFGLVQHFSTPKGNGHSLSRNMRSKLFDRNRGQKSKNNSSENDGDEPADLEFILGQNNDEEQRSVGHLISYKDLLPKQLFFNAEVQQQMNDLHDLLLPENFKKVQQELDSLGKRQGFAIILYGGPGTGKTELCQQLAIQTQRDIYSVDMSQIRERWMGDTEKNAAAIFDNYQNLCKKASHKKNANKPILLLNEADAILGKRDTDPSSSGSVANNAMANVLLERFEKFDGILIATSNLIENMDPAFERRFLFKVHCDRPDLDARTNIWRSMFDHLSSDDAHTLAEEYDNLTGGMIENISRKLIVDRMLHRPAPTLDRLRQLCQEETYANASTRRPLGFLRAS